jgi:hypothetical protein
MEFVLSRRFVVSCDSRGLIIAKEQIVSLGVEYFSRIMTLFK